MPDYQDAFNRALHEARQRFGRIPKAMLRQLYLEYAQMLVRIDLEAGRGIITAERAEALKRSINRELARFGARLETALSTASMRAAEMAAAGHIEALEVASRAANVAISFNFASVPVRAVENMFIRRGIDGLSGTFETLVRRRIRNLQPEIDRILTSAVARGQSAGRLTSELAVAMTRDDPQLALALERIGPRGQDLLRKLHEGKLDELTDIPELRRLLYDSRRIAVSETNTAFFEGDRLAAAESPVVDLVRWRVSGRHHGLKSSPDACTAAEKANPHGYGPGLYHKETVPSLLHSHCQCGTEKVLRPPEKWDDPARPIPPVKALTEEEMKQFLGPKATDKFVKSQTNMLNQKLRAAHKAKDVAVAA